MIQKLIRKIFGHKHDCCHDNTRRCSKCVYCLTKDEAKSIKEKQDSGFIYISYKKHLS